MSGVLRPMLGMWETAMNDASRTSNPMVPTPKEVMYNVAMMELPGIAGAVQAQAQRLYDAAVAQDEEIKRLRAALGILRPYRDMLHPETRKRYDALDPSVGISSGPTLVDQGAQGQVVVPSVEAAPADETSRGI